MHASWSAILFQKSCKNLLRKFGHGKSFGFANYRTLYKNGRHHDRDAKQVKAELEAGGDAVRDLFENDARHGTHLQYPGLPLWSALPTGSIEAAKSNIKYGRMECLKVGASTKNMRMAGKCRSQDIQPDRKRFFRGSGCALQFPAASKVCPVLVILLMPPRRRLALKFISSNPNSEAMRAASPISTGSLPLI